jgi:hypothetical protein
MAGDTSSLQPRNAAGSLSSASKRCLCAALLAARPCCCEDEGWPARSPQDSAWVAERAPFERLMPPDAAEVVLCTANGELLEGLVTNLFVVAGKGALSLPAAAR